MKCVILIVLISIFCAASAWAGAPVNGVYTSGAGAMLTGRFSESWIGGGPGMPGNTIHAQSWNGVSLGTQWEVRCAAVATAPVLLEDDLDGNGNGHRTYRTVYYGGDFRLAGSASWGGGDNEYHGDLAFYTHTTTFQFEGGVPMSYVVNAQLGGYFDGYGRCMQLTIANASSSGNGTQTRAYPDFLDAGAGCAPAEDETGEWGEVHSITLVVLDCNTATDRSSWGMIKTLYR